jgi:hypothetical protein
LEIPSRFIILLEFKANRCTKRTSHLSVEFKETFHEIYKLLARDELKIFALFQHDVLLLLARLDISLLPRSSTADFIGVFDLLLSEITKRFDDYSDEFQSVIRRTSKVMGVFLLSCLNFKLLSTDKITQISSFVLKLTQYYLTLTELIDEWFTHSLKDPDVTYLIYCKRLKPSCFPIYELAKEFLFMDDGLAKFAKDTLLHVVLIGEVSTPLEEWIIESDFPDLILTGLLLNFNQVCYSDNSLVYKAKCEYESLLQFDDYISFVLSILSFSTHDSIRVLFLRSLNTKFFSPLIEFYDSKSVYYFNVLFLLTHTLERIIIPDDTHKYGHSLILQCFAEQYLNPSNYQSTFVLDLFTKALQDHLNEPQIVISLLKIVGVFARAGSSKILTATMFQETHEELLFDSPSLIMPLASMARQIHEDDNLQKVNTFRSMDDSIKRLRKIMPDKADRMRLLKFVDKSAIHTILCLQLYDFFYNDILTNETLINSIMDLVHSNSGYHKGLFLCQSYESLLEEIFNHLWSSYQGYNKQVTLGKKVIRMVKPKQQLEDHIKLLGPMGALKIFDNHHRSKSIALNEFLTINLSLFKGFVIELYSAYQAIFLIHNVVHKNAHEF